MYETLTATLKEAVGDFETLTRQLDVVSSVGDADAIVILRRRAEILATLPEKLHHQIMAISDDGLRVELGTALAFHGWRAQTALSQGRFTALEKLNTTDLEHLIKRLESCIPS